jgi:hypothetical protein
MSDSNSDCALDDHHRLYRTLARLENKIHSNFINILKTSDLKFQAKRSAIEYVIQEMSQSEKIS